MKRFIYNNCIILSQNLGDYMNILNYLKVFREIKENKPLDIFLIAEKTNLSVKEIKRAVKYLKASDMIDEVNSKIKFNVKRLNQVS